MDIIETIKKWIKGDSPRGDTYSYRQAVENTKAVLKLWDDGDYTTDRFPFWYKFVLPNGSTIVLSSVELDDLLEMRKKGDI